MEIKNVALRFLSIVMVISWTAIVMAQQSKVIEFVPADGDSKKFSIRVNDQNLLFETGDGSDSILFTPEALVTIKHKDKSYSIQSYDDIYAKVSKKVTELASAKETPASGTSVALRLTGETETISGLKTRKLINISDGKTTGEIWVSTDLVPVKIRAAGDRLRSILPEDYWGKMHGSVGMPEIIMLYGIPLKIVHNGNKIYQASVRDDSSSRASFEVPPGYRKLPN